MTEAYLQSKTNALRIKRSMSNIAWLDGEENFDGFVALVSNSLYLSAVELSLWNIFQKIEFSDAELNELRERIVSEQVVISGLHNIFADWSQKELSIFDSEEDFELVAQRIEKFIGYAKKLQTKYLSLDYMKSLQLNSISEYEADQIFLKLLRRIDLVANGEVEINIAPSDKNLQNYLNKYVKAIEMLKKENFVSIKILVDLKEMFNTLSFDLKYFKDNNNYLSHFHVSNLDGGQIMFSEIPLHNKIVNISYFKNYINDFFVMKIENLTNDEKENLSNYNKYIHVFKEIYQVPIELSPFCSKLFINLVYRHISAEGPDVEHLIDDDEH